MNRVAMVKSGLCSLTDFPMSSFWIGRAVFHAIHTNEMAMARARNT